MTVRAILTTAVDGAAFTGISYGATYAVNYAANFIVLSFNTAKFSTIFHLALNQPALISPLVGLGLGASFFAVDFLLSLVFKAAFGSNADLPQAILIRNIISLGAVVGGAFLLGFNPFAAASLLAGALLINALVTWVLTTNNASWHPSILPSSEPSVPLPPLETENL